MDAAVGGLEGVIGWQQDGGVRVAAGEMDRPRVVRDDVVVGILDRDGHVECAACRRCRPCRHQHFCRCGGIYRDAVTDAEDRGSVGVRRTDRL